MRQVKDEGLTLGEQEGWMKDILSTLSPTQQQLLHGPDKASTVYQEGVTQDGSSVFEEDKE